MSDINKEVINLALSVEQVNSLLAVLGNAPFVQAANLITEIQTQGATQFATIKAKYDAEAATGQEIANDAQVAEAEKSDPIPEA